MDQKKIGTFLKDLRKEKGITQEQLAEQFNVSDRTVSRWETGSNMPDLSILVELAEYHDVDIREIMNGERKSGNMNTTEKETLQMVADYADTEKEKLTRRTMSICIVGLCAMLVGGVVLDTVGFEVMPVTDYVIGLSFGVTFGSLLAAVLYLSGVLAKVKRDAVKRRAKIWTIGSIAVCIVLFIAALVKSL